MHTQGPNLHFLYFSGGWRVGTAPPLRMAPNAASALTWLWLQLAYLDYVTDSG